MDRTPKLETVERIITYCPECKSSKIYRSVRKGDYACGECKSRFPKPDTKTTDRNRSGVKMRIKTEPKTV